MDTDYISKEAYSIIHIAATFDDTLKSLIGSACSKFDNEDDYLEYIKDLIEEIRANTLEYWEEWGLEGQFELVEYCFNDVPDEELPF
jgi:hypothetical protein